jgi:DNA-binding response OmpR family regulator
MQQQIHSRPTVLFVGKDPERAEEYGRWAGEEYWVGAVRSGERALAVLEEHDVDVLVLGALPDVHPDEVVVAVRDRGLDTRVLLLSETGPDRDLLSRGYDDYIVGGVTRVALVSAVEKLSGSVTYDSLRVELSQLRVRQRVLERERSPAELARHDRYNRTMERIDRLERWATEYRASAGENGSRGRSGVVA